jgi:hypothetical protein
VRGCEYLEAVYFKFILTARLGWWGVDALAFWPASQFGVRAEMAGFGVGMGGWIDLTKAMEAGLIPPNLPTAVIHIMLVCIFAICVACCVARFLAFNNRPRR